MKTSIGLRLRCGLLSLLLLLLQACSQPAPDEARLRATLDLLVQAGEERRTGDFMEHVADDFAGPSDAPDARSLQRYLSVIALRARSISVTRTSTDIQMFGSRATVKISMLITADAGSLLPEARQMDTETGWRVDSGEWKLISAKWD
jgi:hypothetical protein